MSLGSEAAYFFGLLNHASTRKRLQQFLNDKISPLHFPHLCFIECLIVIPTNHWIHCNAYKHLEMPLFVALFQLCTWITQKYSRFESISSSDSEKRVDLSNSGIAWAFPVEWMDRRQLVIPCQARCSVRVLAWVLKPLTELYRIVRVTIGM